MALDSFAVFLAGHDVTLSPAQIERELSSMWKPVSTAAGAPENTSVTRVVLGNVICIGTTDQMERLRGVIQKVVPIYPCRLFLLEFQPANSDPQIHAAINAQCFVPKKDEVPVCCEVIHMTFGPQSAKHLHGCVVPLLLADLQTIIWVSLGDEDVKQIADLKQYSDRSLFQASLSQKPSTIFHELVNSTQPDFDLSWFRTRPIREQMAAFFDDPANDFNLQEIETVEVCASAAPGTGTLAEVVASMIVGWLGAKLRWKAGARNGTGCHFETSTGVVNVLLNRIEEKNGGLHGTLNSIRMIDKQGRKIEVELQTGAADKEMIFRCSRSGAVTSVRNLSLSEHDEADAVGIALNSPSKVKYFRETAALAIPVLESFGK